MTKAQAALGRIEEMVGFLSGDGDVTADFCRSLAAQLRVLARDVDRFSGHCPQAPVTTEATVLVFPGQQR